MKREKEFFELMNGLSTICARSRVEHANDGDMQAFYVEHDAAIDNLKQQIAAMELELAELMNEPRH